MKVCFIQPDAPLWEDCLTGVRHDFYHRPKYVQLCAQQENGTALACVALDGGQRLFFPLIIRPIAPEQTGGQAACDAITPYGYPTPLLMMGAGSENAQQEFFARALREILAALKRRGVVSVFARLHPLLPLPIEPLRSQGTLVRHGETVYLDLSLPEAELWRQIRPQNRTRINQALRMGYVAEIDPRWDHFEDFFAVYTETMRRVDANPYYFFPRAYFHELKAALGNSLSLWIVRRDQAIAAVGLFTECCGIVQFHLSGLRAEFGHDNPMKLMLDGVRRWAKSRGNRWLHLGGGVGCRPDSVFKFKSGFSQLRAEFGTWRAVTDADAYRRLVDRWQSQTDIPADTPEGFFPAYRRPCLRTCNNITMG